MPFPMESAALCFSGSLMTEAIGLSDVQKGDAEAISRLESKNVTPLPQFILKPLQEDGKNLLALRFLPRSTHIIIQICMEAYIRVGNER